MADYIWDATFDYSQSLEVIHDYIVKKYGALNNDTFLDMLKDEYKGWIETMNGDYSPKKITRVYNSFIRTIAYYLREYDFSHCEHACIGQGFFHYMQWKITNIYK